MTDPRRAERLWLAMILATLWVVSVGSQTLPVAHTVRQRASGRPAPRSLSCFCRGRLVLVAALVTGQALPTMRLIPELWPKSLDTYDHQFTPELPHHNTA